MLLATESYKYIRFKTNIPILHVGHHLCSYSIWLCNNRTRHLNQNRCRFRSRRAGPIPPL